VNTSANRDHYFFTFDEEGDDYQGVMSILSHLTNHRVYGTGISACAGEIFHTAVQSSVNGKIKDENSLTYIWTTDKESSMRDYINRGVQGTMTSRVAVAKRVAKPSTAIPFSNVIIPVLHKCDCDYHPGGCAISRPAPSGNACKC
jgi:hypothetical protein